MSDARHGIRDRGRMRDVAQQTGDVQERLYDRRRRRQDHITLMGARLFDARDEGAKASAAHEVHARQIDHQAMRVCGEFTRPPVFEQGCVLG